MNFLPVITRELQVQARQPATNRMRWIAAAAVIALAGLLMIVGGYASPQERAKLIFVIISIICLGGAMLAGVFQTADCLSEERREGTLGLLFLTDLKGYDIVLGKLASTSLQSFYNFLAIVPILALPLLMGGMTVGEFWRVTLVLVVTLYLSLAVGMFISAVSQEARGAMGSTFLVMLALAGLMPVLWWVSFTGGWSAGMKFLLFPAPPYAFQQAFHNYFSTASGLADYWSSVSTMFCIGSGCLLAACWFVPRLWQETGEGKNSRKSAPPIAGLGVAPTPGATKQRLQRSAQPFFWLATRDGRPQKVAFWTFAILLPLWLIFFFQMWPKSNRAQGFALPLVLLIAYGMHLMLKCLMAVEATRRFSEDRQSGALELLLATPLPVAEIIQSQRRGVWFTFRWGIVTLTLMNVALLVFFTCTDMFAQDSEALGMFLLMVLGGLVMLYLDSHALVKVGMWMALVKPRHARAFLATVLRVLLPAWLAVLFIFFMGMAGAINGGRHTAQGVLFMWFFIGGVVDLTAATLASNKLDLHFREIASVGHLENRPALEAVPRQPAPRQG